MHSNQPKCHTARGVLKRVGLCCLGLFAQACYLEVAAAPLELAKGDAVVVSAEHAVEDDSERAMHLRGNVQVHAPTWEMFAAQAILYGNPAAPDVVVADGVPARIRLFRDNGELRVEAEGRHVEYSRADDMVQMTGEAALTDDRRTIRGDRVRYAIQSGRISVEGEKRGRARTRPEP